MKPEDNETRNRWIVIFLTLVFTGLFLSNMADARANTSTDTYADLPKNLPESFTKKQAQAVARVLEKKIIDKAPYRIDKYTTVTTATFYADNFIVFHQVDLDYINKLSKDYDMTFHEIADMFSDNSMLIEEVCTSPELKLLVKAGLTLTRKYSTSKGTYFFKNHVAQWDCDNRKNKR